MSSPVSEARKLHLPFHRRRAEPFHAALHDDAVDSTFLVLRPHHRQLRERCIRDPHLGAVEDDVVSVFLVGGGHATWVRPVVRLRQPEASHPLAGREFGQELLLLFLRSVLPNGVHHERALDRGGGTQTAVATLQLLHDQSVRDLVKASAAVLLRDVWPKRPDFPQSRQQMLREDAVLGGVFDDGADFLLHPSPRGVADELVFLREEVVHVVVVVALVEVCTHDH